MCGLAQEVMRVCVCFEYVQSNAAENAVCRRGGVGRREPATLKTCCKQSLEEGMAVAKKVHGGGLARMEVASSKAMVSRIA